MITLFILSKMDWIKQHLLIVAAAIAAVFAFCHKPARRGFRGGRGRFRRRFRRSYRRF